MRTRKARFWSITLKTIIVHTITYFAVRLFVFTVFDESTWFAAPSLSCFLRQTDDPLVTAGPLFQPMRGFLFGIAFYSIRDALFRRRGGGFTMWVLLILLGIISTFGPAPGSIEGIIYTTLPMRGQVLGLVAASLQSLLLSVVITYWMRHPDSRWLNWVLGVLFILVLLLPALGLLLGQVGVSQLGST